MLSKRLLVDKTLVDTNAQNYNAKATPYPDNTYYEALHMED